MKTPRYIVRGSVRGTISRHNKLSAAIRSLRADQKRCESLRGGAYYSDCKILRGDGEPLSEDEQNEVSLTITRLGRSQ